MSFGFDLRVNPALQEWTMERQRLVPTLVSPISADPSVWIEGAEIEALWKGVVPDYGNALCLAKRMDLLLDDCRKRSISASGLVSVCITSAESNLIALVEKFGPGYFDSAPAEDELLSCGWRSAGDHVVDLSGLIQWTERLRVPLNQRGLNCVAFSVAHSMRMGYLTIVRWPPTLRKFEACK